MKGNLSAYGSWTKNKNLLWIHEEGFGRLMKIFSITGGTNRKRCTKNKAVLSP